MMTTIANPPIIIQRSYWMQSNRWKDVVF